VHEDILPGGADPNAIDPAVHEGSPPPYDSDHEVHEDIPEQIAIEPDVNDGSPPVGEENIDEDSPPPYHNIAIDPDSTPCTKKDMQQMFDKLDFVISSLSSLSSSFRDEVSEVKKTVAEVATKLEDVSVSNVSTGNRKGHLSNLSTGNGKHCPMTQQQWETLSKDTAADVSLFKGNTVQGHSSWSVTAVTRQSIRVHQDINSDVDMDMEQGEASDDEFMTPRHDLTPRMTPRMTPRIRMASTEIIVID